MKEITGLIMTRKGSERVQNKNIRLFGEPKMNLLRNKIRQLQSVKNLKRIVLNTDCAVGIEIAQDEGIDWVKRNPEYAQSYTKPSDLYEHVADCIETDYVLSASVCYPFIKEYTYNRMVDLYIEENMDTFVAVHPVGHHVLINKDGSFRPFNYEPGEQPNSQDLIDFMSVCWGCIITKKEMMLRGDLVGETPDVYEISQEEAIDIDTPLDFSVADFIYKKKRGKQKRCCGRGGCKTRQ